MAARKGGHDTRDGVGAAAKRPESKFVPSGGGATVAWQTPRFTTAGTDRLDTSAVPTAEGPRSHTRGPSAMVRPLRRGRAAERAAGPGRATTLGAMTPAPVDLSVVVPMYNEEAVLPLLVERLRPVADGVGRAVRDPLRRRRVHRRHPGAAAAAAPRVAAGARRPAAGQRRAPGRHLGRSGPGPGQVDGHHRRRPAGPARGDRRDAGRRPGPGGRRGLRGALGPLHRHGVQAAHRRGPSTGRSGRCPTSTPTSTPATSG